MDLVSVFVVHFVFELLTQLSVFRILFLVRYLTNIWLNFYRIYWIIIDDLIRFWNCSKQGQGCNKIRCQELYILVAKMTSVTADGIKFFWWCGQLQDDSGGNGRNGLMWKNLGRLTSHIATFWISCKSVGIQGKIHTCTWLALVEKMARYLWCCKVKKKYITF